MPERIDQTSYKGNLNLKVAGTQMEYTEEQIREYIKCSAEPIYFMQNYMKIINMDKGEMLFDMFDFQKRLIKTVHENRFVIAKLARQTGKALALNTPILSPTGWKSIDTINVGDVIFGADGKETTVIMKTDVMHDHECYEIVFDNGEVIVADADHLWNVGSANWRTKGKKHQHKILKTEDIFDRLQKYNYSVGGRLYVNVSAPLEFNEQQLPIDPYVLGVWLGDGTSACGNITCHIDDFKEYEISFNSVGYIVGYNRIKNNICCFRTENLHKLLRQNELIKNKHIPTKYLFNSKENRWNLLCGLMDTDGSVGKNRAYEFYQKNKNLIEQVEFLLVSLGIKFSTTPKVIKNQTYYTIRFSSDQPPFKLARKLNKAKTNITRASRVNRHYIKTIKKIDSVPVACIQVDNNDHLFLCGKTCIPTHNSTSILGYFCHQVNFIPQYTIGIMANKAKIAIELLGRLKFAFENLPKWLQCGVVEWNKSSIVLENGSKVIAAATSSSAIRGMSCNALLLDEFAFVQPGIAEDFYSSVYPTISSGNTTKIVIISTPNGMNMFYKLWTEAIEKRSKFIAFEANWWDVPGRDAAWKQEQIMNTSEEQFNREHACLFLGSSNTLLSGDTLAKLAAKTPIFKEDEGLKIYEKAKKDHNYILVADTSQGKGLDYHAFSVIDVSARPYQQVATFRNNELDPLHYPHYIYSTAKMYNTAMIFIELNDIGTQISDILYREMEYENMVFTTFRGRNGQVMDAGFGDGDVQAGVKTNNRVKRIGCANLKMLIENDQLIINDYETIKEFTTFVLRTNNKGATYMADKGSHDDLAMGLVLFGWMTTQEYYKELMNTDFRRELHEKEAKILEESIVPFGYIDDNIEPNQEVICGDVWALDQSDRNNTYISIDPWNRF